MPPNIVAILVLQIPQIFGGLTRIGSCVNIVLTRQKFSPAVAQLFSYATLTCQDCMLLSVDIRAAQPVDVLQSVGMHEVISVTVCRITREQYPLINYCASRSLALQQASFFHDPRPFIRNV